MKGFCLLLFVCLVATCGFCQEQAHYDLDAVRPDMADGMLSVEEDFGSEDFLMIEFNEEPQEEGEENLSYDSTAISVSPQFNYRESKYWGRYIALRRAGWITFGTGVVFFISGCACTRSSRGTMLHDDVSDKLASAGSFMLVSSPILVAASIPLFACAYYNRSKAKKMYLNVGASMLPSRGLSPFKTYTPALRVALTF